MVVGNGPAMFVFERSRVVTVAVVAVVVSAAEAVVVGEQVTPYQLHGVESRGFQEDRRESGSSRRSLNW